MSKRRGDGYYKKAKNSGYLARSIYKLEEINNKYKIFSRSIKRFKVIDLGASPGSWMQYAKSQLNDDALIMGIDLSPIKVNAKNLITKQLNVFDEKLESEIRLYFPEGLNLVLSDMAPKTTGIRIKDQYNSYELTHRALAIADKYLLPSGFLVVKIFQGEYYQKFLDECKQVFNEVKTFKPKSSRSNSYEIYVICRGKK